MSEYEGSNILDIDTSDAVEATVVPAGEYHVRITGFRKDSDGNIVRTSTTDRGTNKYFIITFDLPDEITAKGLSKIFSVPTDDMDAKKANMVKWDLECLKRAFSMEEINFSNMVGKEGYAILTVKNDATYGDQNEIKKFIIGA